MARSGGLENNTNDADCTGSPDEDGPPAISVRGGCSEQGADETPGLQDADDVRTEVGPLDVAGVFVCELV